MSDILSAVKWLFHRGGPNCGHGPLRELANQADSALLSIQHAATAVREAAERSTEAIEHEQMAWSAISRACSAVEDAASRISFPVIDPLPPQPRREVKLPGPAKCHMCVVAGVDHEPGSMPPLRMGQRPCVCPPCACTPTDVKVSPAFARHVKDGIVSVPCNPLAEPCLHQTACPRHRADGTYPRGITAKELRDSLRYVAHLIMTADDDALKYLDKIRLEIEDMSGALAELDFPPLDFDGPDLLNTPGAISWAESLVRETEALAPRRNETGHLRGCRNSLRCSGCYSVTNAHTLVCPHRKACQFCGAPFTSPD